jgi:hypothetical protein
LTWIFRVPRASFCEGRGLCHYHPHLNGETQSKSPPLKTVNDEAAKARYRKTAMGKTGLIFKPDFPSDGPRNSRQGTSHHLRTSHPRENYQNSRHCFPQSRARRLRRELQLQVHRPRETGYRLRHEAESVVHSCLMSRLVRHEIPRWPPWEPLPRQLRSRSGAGPPSCRQAERESVPCRYRRMDVPPMCLE